MSIPPADREKLEKLKALRDGKGATPAERASAQDAIDRIMLRNGYRRKANPDPEPQPEFRVENMTPLDIAKACEEASVDLNKALAAMNECNQKLQSTGADIDSLFRDCGKL